MQGANNRFGDSWKKENCKKVFTLHTDSSTHCYTMAYLREDLSQVFTRLTGLHGKVSYFRFSQLKSENGKGGMRREEMWRGKLPLHANNLLLISDICRVCEEWRPNLSICKREIFFPHEGKIKTSRGKNNDKLLAYRNSSKYRSNLNSHENLGVSYR